MFITEGRFNGYLVVGEAAASVDNLAMTDIAEGIRRMGYIITDATKLDSEIEDIAAQNIISVGSPCVNRVSAELMGNPVNCVEGLEGDEGRIKLFQHTNCKTAMLVDGFSSAMTRLAARVIANRPDDLPAAMDVRVTSVDGTWQSAVIEVIS